MSSAGSMEVSQNHRTLLFPVRDAIGQREPTLDQFIRKARNLFDYLTQGEIVGIIILSSTGPGLSV